MKPARFDYARPASLVEALALLREHGDDASVLAGGQSLVPMMNLRLASPAFLIDINALDDLRAIEAGEGVLTIGALARHNDVLRSEVVARHAPLISQALSHVAHEAVRNRGTFGGSLSLADPASELPACAVCLGATLVLQSAEGERRVEASIFFEDLYSTARQEDELLTRVEIPILPGWQFAFDEVSRRHGDFALAGLAMALRIEDAVVAECRIVFPGVESAPRRFAAAEERLVGAPPGDPAALGAALETLEGLEAMESTNCPATYRRHLARALLERLWNRLGKES